MDRSHWGKLHPSVVANYIRYRPSYPPELLSLLRTEIGLTRDRTIADIGSGTGILSKLFLDAGHSVFGVEPDPDMRHAAETSLKGYRDFTSIPGTAENTGLANANIELVTVGQALHWFELAQARREFLRILKDEGHVVLIWNFAQPDSRYFRDYKAFLSRHGVNYAPSINAEGEHIRRIETFFGGTYSSTILSHSQELTWDGFAGLHFSSTDLPEVGTNKYENAIQELRSLFDNQQSNGRVKITYDAKVYFGTIAR